jgi:hypothetical protein
LSNYRSSSGLGLGIRSAGPNELQHHTYAHLIFDTVLCIRYIYIYIWMQSTTYSTLFFSDSDGTPISRPACWSSSTKQRTAPLSFFLIMQYYCVLCIRLRFTIHNPPFISRQKWTRPAQELLCALFTAARPYTWYSAYSSLGCS